jgi:hypothetical protein
VVALVDISASAGTISVKHVDRCREVNVQLDRLIVRNEWLLGITRRTFAGTKGDPRRWIYGTRFGIIKKIAQEN